MSSPQKRSAVMQQVVVTGAAAAMCMRIITCWPERRCSHEALAA